MAEVSGQLVRVLSDQGSLFMNVSFTSDDPYVDLEVANLLRADWVLQNRICWAKAVEVKGIGYGHFGSVRSRFHVDVTSEQIMHLTKDGHVPIDRMAIGVPYTDKSNIARFNRPADRRCQGNIWYIPYPPVTDQGNKGNRPATFPVEVPKMCIKLHGLERVRTVLDPFSGTGATLAAALELGVTGIGIDIDPGYSVMALERLMDMCAIERATA